MSRRTRAGSARLRIALCVIARNEERFIADCLDSARPFVDQMVVVDTGSTDRTVDIARQMGARVKHFTWCDDFAAARNAAIEYASSDWILMLDADERLDRASGARLRALVEVTPPTVHALSPLIENHALAGVGTLSSTTGVPRIFRRDPRIRFSGAIHEVVVFENDPLRTTICTVPEIRIIHYGYDAEVYEQRSKDARNVALLERELQRESYDPRMPFFLLEQHVIAKRDVQALAVYDIFVRGAHRLPRKFGVEAAYLRLVALCRLAKVDAVEGAVAEAEQQGTLGAAALDLLGEFCAQLGELDRSIAYLGRLLHETVPDGLKQRDGLGGWQTRLKYAELCKRRHGDAAPAREALAHVEAEFGNLPPERRPGVALETASSALRLEEPEAARQWLERALACAPDTYEAQRQIMQVAVDLAAHAPELALSNSFAAVDSALAQDDLQTMYDLAFELPPTLAGVARLVAVVERLRDAGEFAAALGLLNRALDGPRVEHVYWLLIKTLSDLGRYQEAQLALEALRGRAGDRAA